MGRLNALSVKNAKPGRHQDGDGLFLNVLGSGKASWVLRVQADGRRRDFGLGSYPLVSLLEAREHAFQSRKLIREGIDPSAAKRAQRALKSTIPTFEAAATAAHAERREKWRSGKHVDQWLSTLRRFVFPAFGTMRVDEVTAPMIRDALQPIWLSKPETARRVLQRVGTVLDWAHAKGFRSSESPTRSVLRGLAAQPKRDRHYQAVPYEQLPTVMKKLATRDSVGRSALRFLVLTAARSGEVRGATWEEIDMTAGLWNVPGERMKAGKAHTVPLSAPALAILKAAEKLKTGRSGELVFPGQSGKAMSDMTLSKALRSARPGKDTVHGFRSSFRDWAAEQTDVAGEVVEAALAHTVANKVEAAYRRTDYLAKRRSLMDGWAAYVGA